MAEQEPVQDAQDLVSAKRKMIGVAVTWDAEQIFFLPASRGATRQEPVAIYSCRWQGCRGLNMLLSKHRSNFLQIQERL